MLVLALLSNGVGQEYLPWQTFRRKAEGLFQIGLLVQENLHSETHNNLVFIFTNSVILVREEQCEVSNQGGSSEGEADADEFETWGVSTLKRPSNPKPLSSAKIKI